MDEKNNEEKDLHVSEHSIMPSQEMLRTIGTAVESILLSMPKDVPDYISYERVIFYCILASLSTSNNEKEANDTLDAIVANIEQVRKLFNENSDKFDFLKWMYHETMSCKQQAEETLDSVRCYYNGLKKQEREDEKA